MTQAHCHFHRPAMPLGWLKGRKHKPLGDLALASVLLCFFIIYIKRVLVIFLRFLFTIKKQIVMFTFCNFSISHGIAILMERSRMMVGNGGIVLISDTRSIKYCQKEIPSLRQVFFRLINVSRH